MLPTIFIGTGLLFILLGVPLTMRRVGPNGWYGLRVPATLADDWVWYEANARSGRDFVVVGLCQIVAAVATHFQALSRNSYVGFNASVLLVGALAAAGLGWWRANHLLEQRRRIGE